jgi:hypothetical protein
MKPRADLEAMHDETSIDEHRALVRLGREIAFQRHAKLLEKEATWNSILRGVLTWGIITVLTWLGGAALLIGFKIVSIPWLRL